MADEIMKKLEEHDQKFIQHDRRFDEHDKRFDQIDKRFDEHDKRFDEHDKRFDQIDSQIDLVVHKVLEHDERLDRIENYLKTEVATKSDMNKIVETLDVIVGLHKKTDQEVTFLGSRVKRLEEKHENDVVQLRQAILALT